MGVSAGDAASHAKFATKYKLPFPLLSDPDRKVMTKYGAYGERMLYGKKTVGVIRSTAWIGPDGKVRRHWAKVANAETASRAGSPGPARGRRMTVDNGAPARVGAPARRAACTAFALVAFASNSVLCRLALGGAQADPAAFTGVRLLSGALVLWLLTLQHRRPATHSAAHHWAAAFLLFAYAATFSFAYVSLSAGTGALILFGSVQATMLLAALAAGERPHPLQWVGLGLVLAGLVYLVVPGLTAPPLRGSILMAVAGISWGAYSLYGRGTVDPLADAASNFMRALPFTVGLALVTFAALHASSRGILLAVVSGALASGLGYVAWYAALRHLTGTQAATVQRRKRTGNVMRYGRRL